MGGQPLQIAEDTPGESEEPDSHNGHPNEEHRLRPQGGFGDEIAGSPHQSDIGTDGQEAKQHSQESPALVAADKSQRSAKGAVHAVSPPPTLVTFISAASAGC
ncbi:hypothetical protein D3C80_1810050 [compost metagenome]